jgi:hypothetical protein
MIGYKTFIKSTNNYEKDYKVGIVYDELHPSYNYNNGYMFVEMPIDLFCENPIQNMCYMFDSLEFVEIYVLGNISHNQVNHFSTTNKFKINRILSHSELLDCIKDGEMKTYSGDIFTFHNKMLHSIDDKPAIQRINGDKKWYKEGKIHRSDDLPAIIELCPSKITYEWWINGKIHRDKRRHTHG